MVEYKCCITPQQGVDLTVATEKLLSGQAVQHALSRSITVKIMHMLRGMQSFLV
jgi:hypothetical protein